MAANTYGGKSSAKATCSALLFCGMDKSSNFGSKVSIVLMPNKVKYGRKEFLYLTYNAYIMLIKASYCSPLLEL